MKKNIIYISLVVLGGLLIGFLFFKHFTKEENHSTQIAVSQEHNHSGTTWTCPMHPQVSMPEKGTCPICGMDLVPKKQGGDLGKDQIELTENAMALANIQTVRVSDAGISKNNEILSGRVSQSEEEKTIQTAHFPGRIEQLYVRSEGQQVKRGQTIALVYSPELVTAQNEFIVTLSMKQSQPNVYRATRNKLKDWKLSDRQIQQIEKTKTIKKNFPLISNVSGTVTSKMVDVGSYVSRGAPLFEATNLGTTWAEFDVYDDQLEDIQIGDKIKLIGTRKNQKNEVKISFIDPIMNEQTRTVIVRGDLPNKGYWKPGMFLKGTLEKNVKKEDPRKKNIQIPKTSVLWTGKRSIVYVRVSETPPKFQMREITLGRSIGDSYEVINGLRKGEDIVTNGVFTVDAAAQLSGKSSMMYREGGAKRMQGHSHHATTVSMDSSMSPMESSMSSMESSMHVSQKKSAKFETLLDRYFALKNALISDDLSQAKSFAKEIAKETSSNEKWFDDSATQASWEKTNSKIHSSAKKLTNAKTIDDQRSEFQLLSKIIVQAIEQYGSKRTIYKQFCPMANNGKGAFWASTKKQVENPYFGSQMRSCGSSELIIE